MPERYVAADGQPAVAMPHGGTLEPLLVGGLGATGTVMLVRESSSRRFLALKHVRGDRITRARFAREADTVRRLSHPRLLCADAFWETPEAAFATMRWIEGPSLRDLIGTGERLSIAEVLYLVHSLAQALHVAHVAGIVHRDVKPANILLDTLGTPYLCDFGVAKHEDAVDVTRTGAAVGSPAYMSPEQIRGEAGPASDQYALGIVAFECLRGTRPFHGSAFDVQLGHLTQEPPDLDLGSSPLAVRAAALIARSLRKVAGERWPSLDVVATESALPDDEAQRARALLASRIASWRRRTQSAALVLRRMEQAVASPSAPALPSGAATTARRPVGRRRVVTAGSVAVGAVSIATWWWSHQAEAPVMARPAGTPDSGVVVTPAEPRASADPPAPTPVQPVTGAPSMKTVVADDRVAAAAAARKTTITAATVRPESTRQRSVVRQDSAVVKPAPETAPQTRGADAGEVRVAPPATPARGESDDVVLARVSAQLQAGRKLATMLTGPARDMFVERMSELRWPRPAGVRVASNETRQAIVIATYDVRNAIGRPERWIARFDASAGGSGAGELRVLSLVVSGDAP